MKFESILEWYSGKARDTIVQFTIPALVECEELGYWKKGVSRTVKATLNKMTAAQKWARACEKTFGEMSHGSLWLPSEHPFHDVQRAMQYGSFERAPKVLQKLLSTKIEGRQQKEHLPAALAWAKAFTPIAHLVALLDERRPKPTIIFKTLSPTVVANLSKSMQVNLTTIESPPMHGEWIEMEVKGQKVQVYEIVIDWPEGTLHDQSRFSVPNSKAFNFQCHACGHAIKDPWNWVPILADAETSPKSLWVGKDCARKLFGCEVEGDAVYKR